MKIISQNNSTGANKSNNRRCFSANGFSLLPLALRPRLFCLVALLVMIVFISTLSNDSVSATASTLTLTVGSNTLSLNLKPVSPNGTFASSSNLDIGARTNNYTGYTLKIAAETAADRTLSDTNGNSIAPISTAINLATFSGEDSTTYNNQWGYLPSRYCTDGEDATTCTNNTVNYYPAPSTTGDVLDITGNANTEDETYTVAIGARATTSTKASTYEGTFVIQMVANNTPYSITYNKNTLDTVENMPANVDSDVYGEIATISDSIPTRSGYIFTGWCTVAVADNTQCESPNAKYTAGGAYTLDQTAATNSLELYAMWGDPPIDLTFTVGDENIETIIIADSSQNYKPFYATSGNPIVFPTPTANTKYIVTVVPKANYKFAGWERLSYAGTLGSPTLLTTTYTAGNIGETFTAKSVAGSYTTMQDLDLVTTIPNDPNNESRYCPTAGANVTDSRDGKSYTVAKFGDYCYMLSNLRLAGSTNDTTVTLKSDESDVTSDFVMPNQTTWSNHYCEKKMHYINQEYYYNWYAAMTNPTTGQTSSSSCADETRDSASLGSICPKGWTLPTYNDITAATLWNDGANPGMLATSGNSYSGSQDHIGSRGYWWSGDRSNDGRAFSLNFTGASVARDNYNKYIGFSVRCMRSN